MCEGESGELMRAEQGHDGMWDSLFDIFIIVSSRSANSMYGGFVLRLLIVFLNELATRILE